MVTTNYRDAKQRIEIIPPTRVPAVVNPQAVSFTVYKNGNWYYAIPSREFATVGYNDINASKLINKVLSLGGIVLIKGPGTFALSAGLTIGVAGTRLTMDKNAVLKPNTGMTDNTIFVNNNDVVLDNLNIDTTNTSVSGSAIVIASPSQRATIYNCNILMGNGAQGIWLGNGTGVCFVHSNRVQSLLSPAGNGILIEGADHHVWENDIGGFPNGAAISVSNADDISLIGNQTYTCAFGLDLYLPSRLRIIGNHINFHGQEGIRIHADSGTWNLGTITGNFINNNGQTLANTYAGIHVYTSGGAIIKNGTIVGNIITDVQTIKTQKKPIQIDDAGFQNSLVADNAQTGNLSDPDPSFYSVWYDGVLFRADRVTGQTDYVGTSAVTVINSALLALTNGGIVLVRKGLYPIASTIHVTPSSRNSMMLLGEGDGTQLQLASGITGIDIIGGSAFGAAGPFQTIIENLTVTSVLATRGAKGIYVKNTFGVWINNVRVFYPSTDGIGIEDSAGIFLTDVYVEGCTGNGFHIAGSRDIYAKGCFSDTNNRGFLFDSSPASNTPYKCKFVACTATICTLAGWDINSSSSISLEACVSEGNGAENIKISDSTTVDVTDAHVSGGAGLAIYSNASDMSNMNIRIKGGTYFDNGFSNGILILSQNSKPIGDISIIGVSCLNNGNTQISPTYDGISIQGTSGAISNVTIIDCICQNRLGGTAKQRYGISSSGSVSLVTIRDCDLLPNATAPTSLVAGSAKIYNTNGVSGAGVVSITLGASPFTYTNNDNVPEEIDISDGVVSDISKNSSTIFTATPASVWLEPGEAIVVTWSIEPTIKKDRK